MKKVNLNFDLKTLDGIEVVPSAKAGKLLAQSLVNETRGDALKFYSWAVEFNSGNEISLDESDFETLKTYVKNSERLTILSKAQILKSLTS